MNKKNNFKQSRNWCFTLFAGKGETRDERFDILKDKYNSYKDIIRYMCMGKEICPKTGNQHIQGWIQLVNKKTLGGVKRLVGFKDIHLESCRGSEYDNDKYCKKEGAFFQEGKFICQGQRTDLENIKKRIDEGDTMLNIANDYFGDFIRYHKGLSKYQELRIKENTKDFRELKVIVLEGKTGTGKTRKAMKKCTYKIEGDSLKWWDGYNQDKTILIDEYDNQVSCTKLLNILDGYRLRLDIKGGFTYANWNTVYITTNNDWDHWHPNAKPEHRRALKRRITKWIKM